MNSLIKQFNRSNFFSTQATSPSSSTGQKKRTFKSNNLLAIKALNKYKQSKRIVKSVQKQYSQVMQKSHRCEIQFDQVKRKSQLIRFKFIKIYQNKRYNLLNQQLKIKLTNQKEQFQSSSTERVRQIKQNRDHHLAFLKNQQETIKKQLQKNNKQNKQNMKSLLEKTHSNLNEFVNKNSSKIKDSSRQFLIRKSNYLMMKGSKAKFNYMNKLREQVQMIKQYQNLLQAIPSIANYVQQLQYIMNNSKTDGFATQLQSKIYTNT